MGKTTTPEEPIILEEEGLGDESVLMPGENGMGPGVESWDQRKRNLPKDWKPRRIAPRNHNGRVGVGDQVTFVNVAESTFAAGPEKGQVKTDQDPPYRRTLKAYVSRIVNPDKCIVDLRVLNRDSDEMDRVFDIPAVVYDKAGQKPRSWH